MSTTLAAVRVVLRNSFIIASLEGEVDLSNAHAVREQVLGAIPNTATGLILDMSKTAYLDSQGIQVLLDVAESLGVRRQRIRLMVPEGALIRRVLSLTSIGNSLPIDSKIEEAVAQLRNTD